MDSIETRGDESDALRAAACQETVEYSIVCKDVRKTFPVANEALSWRIVLGLPLKGKRIVALDKISLSVPKGKIVGILGRNGAGKSTLLRTLAGVYLPDSGTIRINGNTSALFEFGGLGNFFITGREYSKRYLLLCGAAASELDALIQEICDFSELGDYFDRRIITYSSGMAARLFFAAATALHSDIYLIDEALSVGDEHFQGKCCQRVRERLSKGASGILVTHDWSAVIKLCEVSHVLDRGQIVESGPSQKIVASYLGLSIPEQTTARFCVESGSTFYAESGEDAEFSFEVELLEAISLAFAYSLEMLRIGVGWEILLISDFEFITDKPGKHRIFLSIPKLPIAPGEYSFNIFLSEARKHDKAGTAAAYDVRSWTYGNELRLIVTGRPRRCVTNLCLEWRRKS
ncbi:MAG: polysaccharide ABC transporter ATP-binding protein [Pyrinomonadaceae bacterium]